LTIKEVVCLIKYKESSIFLLMPDVPHLVLQSAAIGGLAKGKSIKASDLIKIASTPPLSPELVSKSGMGMYGLTAGTVQDAMDNLVKTKRFFSKFSEGTGSNQLYDAYVYGITSAALQIANLLWLYKQDNPNILVPMDADTVSDRALFALVDEINVFTQCLLRKLHIAGSKWGHIPDPSNIDIWDVKDLYECWSGKEMAQHDFDRLLSDTTSFVGLLDTLQKKFIAAI